MTILYILWGFYGWKPRNAMDGLLFIYGGALPAFIDFGISVLSMREAGVIQ